MVLNPSYLKEEEYINSLSKKKKKKYLNDNKIRGYTQNSIPISDIVYGMIKTTDGRFVKIIEVYPINFYGETISEQSNIIKNYEGLFRISPNNLQIKTVAEKADVENVVSNIIKQCPIEYEEQRNNYISLVREIGRKMSIIYRYFIIFEYDGDIKGKRSNKIDDIYSSIQETTFYIKNVLERYGNIVVVPEDESMFIADILYKHFNKVSSKTESLSARMLRIINDTDYYYNKMNKNESIYNVCDYIAPKGIYFNNKNYVMVDGMYYTYLALVGNRIPEIVFPTWHDIFKLGVGIDTDFYIKKLDKDIQKAIVDKKSQLKESSLGGKTSQKTTSLFSDIKNNVYISNKLDEGEDLFACAMIITCYAHAPTLLVNLRNRVIKHLYSKNIKVEEAYMNQESFFKMTMPLTRINQSIFNRNKRNYLTSSLASTYNFTSYEVFDVNGTVLGVNSENGSIVSSDPFNTKRFKNPHILIIGTTGSGKTFTEQVFSRRQLLMGRKCYFILPTKGYEYELGIKNMGGTFVNLVPGSNDCLNLMELRPENNINANRLDDEDKNNLSTIVSTSVLSKKITFLVAWFQSLITNKADKLTSSESAEMNSLLMILYENFGFTNDNDSLYCKKGEQSLKTMPIISDWCNLIMKNNSLNKFAPLLNPFIVGTCKNLNAQTNIDLNNNCVAFSVEEEVIGEEMLPAFLLAAFNICDNLIKSEKKTFSFLFLDEIWKMLQDENCAKLVQKEVKLLRGYGGSVVLATQDIDDCFANKYGASVLSNTETKIILKLEESELDKIEKVLRITDKDRMTISNLDRGEALIITNKDKVKTNIKASFEEIELFTTDRNVKNQIAKIREQEKLENIINNKEN